MESSKLKLKGKSYNVVSLADDAVTVASLSDSEEENLILGTTHYLSASSHLVWKAVLMTVQPDS